MSPSLIWNVSLAVLLSCFGCCVSYAVSSKYECEMCNDTAECSGTGTLSGRNLSEECLVSDSVDASSKIPMCFVLWSNSTGTLDIKLKGCFSHSPDCFDSRCVDRRQEGSSQHDFFFCCCSGSLCNKNFFWEPAAAPSTEKPSPVEKTRTDMGPILWPLLPIAIILLFGIVFCLAYRHKKTPYFNEVPTMDPHPLSQPSPNIGLRPIQLIEIKANGRFGSVWKAQFKNDVVAVKIFPIQDKQSWASEQMIYKLPHMKHDCILYFIGAEKRGDHLQAEFWLISAYHDKGSLCDFLKANTLTWPQLCKIAETMSRGLMHLHEEMAPTKTEGYKPAVAHRDFKSKNVLLKSDLTACVADFGLALVFQPGKPCGDTHGQVGTRRYMAPEVLEGAINFSRDAFLRIDMYACGLVLWELASRCSAQEGSIGEYQLPFEEEVGQHPSLEDMQECVVHKKQRPILRNTWKSHPGLMALCDTMEECWDHDAEARLSASCVMERIALQSRLAYTPPLLINDPNLMDMNN